MFGGSNNTGDNSGMGGGFQTTANAGGGGGGQNPFDAFAANYN